MFKKKINNSEAIDFAFKILSFSDSTEHKLKIALKKKGFKENQINDAIKYLKEKNYINDERYAINYINKCMREAKKGPKIIFYELSKKGIKKNLSLNLIKQLISEEKEIEIINKIISKDKKEKNYIALINKLIRKGFRKSSIKKAIKI